MSPHSRRSVHTLARPPAVATYDHTPRGRGYDAALHYFHHANDYWTFTVGSCPSTGANASSKAKVAVVDLSLSIEAAECFGLLGANGCGKSTTMAMLSARRPC